jgi:hypothetical protein
MSFVVDVVDVDVAAAEKVRVDVDDIDDDGDGEERMTVCCVGRNNGAVITRPLHGNDAARVNNRTNIYTYVTYYDIQLTKKKNSSKPSCL